MNENQRELTSALLDGELDRDAQHRAVSAVLAAGPEELERFGRYRLMGDIMRGEAAVLATPIAVRVHRALQDEPVVLAPRRAAAQWLRPVTGLALAASVAAAAVVLAPQLLTQPREGGASPQIAAATQRPAAAPILVAANPAEPALAADTAAPGTRWQGLDPELEDRLNRLVIEHHEFGGRSGVNGPVPHIGFVSYDAR